MIVQCNKCQTKFRLPDNRMKAGGVKVRCSRCAHVFKVRMAAEQPAPPPPAPPPPSSIATGGTPPPEFDSMPTAAGFDAQPPPAAFEPPRPAPAPVKPPAIVLLPKVDKPPPGADAHDSTLMDPNADAWRASQAAAAQKNQAAPMFLAPDAPPPFEGPAPTAPMAPKPDPGFPSAPGPSPSFGDLGPPPSSAMGASPGFGDLGSPPSSGMGASPSLGDLGSPAPLDPPASDFGAPAAFGGGGIGDPQPPPSGLPDFGAPPAPSGLAPRPSELAPGFGDLAESNPPPSSDGGLPPVDALFNPGTMPGLDQLPSPSDLGMGSDMGMGGGSDIEPARQPGIDDAVAAFAAPPKAPVAPATGGMSLTPGGDSGFNVLPPAGGGGGGGGGDPFGDPFAALEPGAPPPGGGNPDAAGAVGFDGRPLDTAPLEGPELTDGIGQDFNAFQTPPDRDDTGSALGRIELVKAPAGENGLPQAPPEGQVRAAEALAERAFKGPEPGAIIRGVLVLLLVAGGAFGALWLKTEGDLTRVNQEMILEIIGQAPDGPSPAAVVGIEPEGTRAVLYPVGDAGEVLIVSGTARNTSEKPQTGLRAHVTILDGREVVAERDAWVGERISDLRLARMKRPTDVDVVVVEARRANRVGATTVLPPGETLDFMVLFAQVPEDVARRAVRVEFRSAAGVAAAGADE